MSTNKNDRNDARGIAQAVRVGFIREVDLKPNEHIDIKNLLVARKSLVEQRTTLKNRLRGLLKSFGLRFSTTGKKSFLNDVKEVLESPKCFLGYRCSDRENGSQIKRNLF